MLHPLPGEPGGLALRIEVLRTPAITLLQDWSVHIAPGCIHTLMGPSGAGKSSVLSAICGTLPAGLEMRGEVVLDGRRIDQLPIQARRVGILFQDDLLFAHMTVLENLLFALPRGPAAERETRARSALADVEMGSVEQADPATLSGGQRARVALARALLAEPRALLLDEPFSRLDAALRSRMRALVFDLVRSRNIPALLVTHDSGDIADSHHLTKLSAA